MTTQIVDLNGDTWTIKIRFEELDTIYSHAGFKLHHLLDEDRRVALDPALQMKVLESVLLPQASKRGISRAELRIRFGDGDVLFRAFTAVLREAFHFFPKAVSEELSQALQEAEAAMIHGRSFGEQAPSSAPSAVSTSEDTASGN